ncbi:syntaxin 16 [Candida albicans P78042]|nr:syntaxin 16 [Candida albicans P34048]KGU32335.1 syntaxin 16 [Candida albicans P75063]KGU34831.1 syntaxin 16 [Candida albicans P57055]KHC72145.1 syntaxin 16 [Candida albicans P75016]KHC82295.1 syntaxin 16 [Candida albicans P78042]
MFRDRTNLFLSYRRTIPRDSFPTRRTRFSDLNNEEENEGLILSSTTGNQSNRKSKNKSNLKQGVNDLDNDDYEDNIELKPMIPNIFDIAKELDSYLNIINKDIEELNSMYKKLIIINKLNKLKLEKQIEEINYQILIKFEKCYVLIKKFEYLSNNHQRLKLNYNQQDLEILINFKKNYAVKIQDKSLIFRNLQNNYMKFLKNDEEEKEEEEEDILNMNDEQATLLNEGNDSKSTTPRTTTTTTTTNFTNQQQQQQQQQVQVQLQLQHQQGNNNIQYLQQREREISKLAHGIIEISTIFKEMESMVIEQGTILDRIDYNLVNTVQDLKQADKELIKAHHYQKRSTKCKIIFFLSLCVFALLMIFILRPTKTTSPSNDSNSNSNSNSGNPGNPGNNNDQEPTRPNIDKPANEVNPPPVNKA